MDPLEPVPRLRLARFRDVAAADRCVTFHFTGVEGSTWLVKQLRDRYPVVLAEHQRLLRAAFAAHGAHEIDTQGDSFCVAFASARWRRQITAGEPPEATPA